MSLAETTAPVASTETSSTEAPPRPWFLRTEYYYCASKDMYRYISAFPVVSSVAPKAEMLAVQLLDRFANTTMEAIDDKVVPMLKSVDDEIDTRFGGVAAKVTGTVDSLCTEATSMKTKACANATAMQDDVLARVNLVKTTAVDTVKERVTPIVTPYLTKGQETYNDVLAKGQETYTEVIKRADSAKELALSYVPSLATAATSETATAESS